MMRHSLAGAIILLLIIALCGIGSAGEEPNCGNGVCHPPNVCCRGACYPPCPANTIISQQCACVLVPAPATPVPALATPVPAPAIPVTTSRVTPVITPEVKSTTAVQAPLSSHLLVWYDFEDDFTVSGRVTDRSGKGRDAIVKQTVTAATGIAGTKGIGFTGRGYILASDNPAAIRKEVTFSFWFKTADPDANYKMASAARWQGGPGSGWTMATHVPEFWSDDGQGVLVPAQQNLANNFRAGAWNHEVVTYDGIEIREYTNGKLINTWKSRGVPLGSGEPMAVGGWPQFSGYNFVGEMDDFRVYDYALKQQEITSLYSGDPVKPVAPPSTGKSGNISRNFSYVVQGEAGTVDLTLDSATQRSLAAAKPAYHGNKTAYYRAYMTNPLQKAAILKLASQIRSKTPRKEDQVRIAISMVQNIPYDFNDLNATSHPMMVPYEVLAEKTGVCSEKSLLLASLLEELGYGTALFEFPAQQHMAVGIKSPGPYDYNNTGYAFIETTRPGIPTYDKGSYGYAGKLTPPLEVIPISNGLSFDSIALEYMDAQEYNRITASGPRLERIQYLQWKALNRKYGITAGN